MLFCSNGISAHGILPFSSLWFCLNFALLNCYTTKKKSALGDDDKRGGRLPSLGRAGSWSTLDGGINSGRRDRVSPPLKCRDAAPGYSRFIFSSSGAVSTSQCLPAWMIVIHRLFAVTITLLGGASTECHHTAL